MGQETIELAKNYDPKKSVFPAVAQRKWDGVPVRFMCASRGVIVPVTRQGERITSIDHLVPIAAKAIRAAGGCIVGELIVPGKDFKEISGLVRRKAASPELICKVFDGDLDNQPLRTWASRMFAIDEALEGQELITTCTGRYVISVEGVEKYYDDLKATEKDEVEGVMFHDPYKPFRPGKRCWGMGRWKPQPVATLEVVGFEEAHSEAGRPLGMVGRVNVRLRRRGGLTGWAKPSGGVDDWAFDAATQIWTTIVGVGPGKLTHDERKQLWAVYGADRVQHLNPVGPLYADIKYMPDPSYDALRQPTFQCWRPDKTEGDIID